MENYEQWVWLIFSHPFHYSFISYRLILNIYRTNQQGFVAYVGVHSFISNDVCFYISLRILETGAAFSDGTNKIVREDAGQGQRLSVTHERAMACNVIVLQIILGDSKDTRMLYKTHINFYHLYYTNDK